MPVDIEIVQQRTKDRIVKEYAFALSVYKPGQPFPSGMQERANEIYKEEFDKELRNPTHVPPILKPVVATCNYNQPPFTAINNPNIKCNMTTVTVEKEGRKHILNINKESKTGDNVLEIVAGPSQNSKEVTIKVGGLEGPCNTHKSKVMDLVNPKPTSKSDTVLKFKASSYWFNPFEDGFWPNSPKINSYNIPVSTCNGKSSAIIKVYPDIEYNIDFSLNLATNTKGYKYGSYDKDSAEFEIKAAFSQDSKKIEISKKFEEIGKAIHTADTIVKKAQKVARTFGSMVDLEYKYANLKIGLKCKWVEIEGSPKCGFEYSYDFGMTPIFGVTVKIDALGAAVYAIAGFGPLIAKLKEQLEESDILTIKMTLSLSGELGCVFAAIKEVKDLEAKCTTCNAYGKVTVGIKGEISATTPNFDGKSFWAKAAPSVGLGAEAGGEASIKLGAKFKNSAFEIYYNFPGLEFKAACFAKASFAGIEVKGEWEGKTTFLENESDILITSIKTK